VDGGATSQQTDTGVAPGTADTFHRSFATAADHTVSVDAKQADCPDVTNQVTEHVVNPIAGNITASTQQPVTGTPITFTVHATGGYPPLSYAWDTSGSNTFTNGTGISAQATFTTPGNHTVKVRVRDSAAKTHERILSMTVNVAQNNCKTVLDFGIAEITTGGCLALASSNPDTYTTSDAIKVNGIPFGAAPSGTHYTITLPSTTAPGGEINLGNTSINLDGFVPFRGAIDWKLPAGGRGDEKQVAQLSVPGGTKIKGLSVTGSIALRLGYGSDGTHYATFPMNIALPDVFKSGPASQSGGVSASGSIRVDLAGVHYDGLRLMVSNVWVGKLQVQQLCFSFVPGGSETVQPCPVPSLGGQPFITCNDNASIDRWDGNAVIVLPTGSHPKVALFGGVAGGRVSKLGGFVDHLGTTLPLAEGIYLTRIGVGLCLYPPPFKLRGDVGVSVLPAGGTSTVSIDGSFLYTDSFGFFPWSLQLGGSMSIFDRSVGDGSLTIRPTGSIDFSLHASYNLFSIVNIGGSVVGWLEIPRHAFNIDGTVRGCIKTLCASAEAVLSSVGTAGCLHLFTLTYYVLVKNHNWHWYAPWRVHWEKRTKTIEAGFGYRWHASSVSLFGGSCDLGAFSARRAADIAAAGVHVAPGTPLLALRVSGSGSPFRVSITMPNGKRIVTPADGSVVSSAGHYLLVPNESDRSIDVLLIRPAAGTWKVNALNGSTVSGVQRAGFEAPPDVAGAVAAAAHGRKVVSLAYALPSGESMSLVERGSKSEHTIAARVHGHRCPGPNRPGGESLLCAKVSFSPAFGPGGKRQIIAVVTRGGLPVTNIAVASFRVGAPALPRKPAHLQLARRSNSVVLAWRTQSVASSYSISIKLSTGRMFGMTVPARCSGVNIRSVARSVGVSVEVAGLRQDLASGPFAHGALASGHARSGAGGKLPKPIC
jgi:hypothetical protein